MLFLRLPVLSTLVLVTLAVAPAGRVLAGSKVYVGRNVASNQRVSMDRIDHRAWDGLLQKYVDTSGNVDYTTWKRSSADVRALDDYLNLLSQTDAGARTGRADRLAFWINAYNAVTIKGILREYPTTSIRNHTAKFYGYNIWKDLLLVVGGAPYSLEQIEHELLRKMGEPRIHFAIVCASRSCPRLLNEAYTSSKLDEQLTVNTKVFFANTGNFRHDGGGRRFYLSTILKWFGEDFGGDQAAQLKTIAPYLPNQAAQRAALAGAVKVSYLSYDWGLNDQATVRSAQRR